MNNTEKRNRNILIIAIALVVIAAIVIIRYFRADLVRVDERYVQEHTPILNYDILEEYTEQEVAVAILDIFTLYRENKKQIVTDFNPNNGPLKDFLGNHTSKIEERRNYFLVIKNELHKDNLNFCKNLLEQILDRLPKDTVFNKYQLHDDLEDYLTMNIIDKCKADLEKNDDFQFFMDVDGARDLHPTVYKAYDTLYHDRLEAEAVRMLNDEEYCYEYYYVLMFYFKAIGQSEKYQERLDVVCEVIRAQEAEEEAAVLKKLEEQRKKDLARIKKEKERKKRIEESKKKEQNREIDYEDCDIEAYYEDNKDLFENYDEAYDDFMDNPGEWEFYH